MRIWDAPYGWLVLAAAIIALLSRLIINLIFWSRFGAHAARMVEVWYYTANPVRQTYALLPFDPTVPILAAAIGLNPTDPYHAVVACGWLLTAATVAGICLAGRELFRLCGTDDPDLEERARRFGLATGLLFGASGIVLSMNLAGFTHDQVAFPFCALALWGLARIGTILRRRENPRRIAGWLAMIATSLLLASRVGPTVYFVVLPGAVGVALVLYAQRRAVGPALGRWLAAGVPAALFVILVFCAQHPSMAAWRHGIRELIFEHALAARGIDARAQYAAGSMDLGPMIATDYLVSYNVLFLLVPPALWLAWRHRAAVSLMLLAVAVPGMMLVSRLSRAGEFGLALLLAGPLALHWGERPRRWLPAMLALYVIAIYVGLAELARGGGMAAGPGQVASLLVGESGRSLRLVLLVMTAAGLAVVLPLITADRRRGGRRDSSSRGAHVARRLALTRSATALVIAGIMFKNFGASAGTTDADWSALTATRASVEEETDSSAGRRGRILSPWIDGFMTWALTGLDPACDVEEIDRKATLIYWCHDAEAALACRERGISHIFWSSRYYRATLSSDSAGQPIVTHLTAERALFYQESGWPERNRARGGDPNMVYTLISLMGQPRAELAIALPSFDLVAEASARGSPGEPGARVFRLRESARSSYELPIPDLPSPAVAAMSRP